LEEPAHKQHASRIDPNTITVQAVFEGTVLLMTLPFEVWMMLSINGEKVNFIS